MCGKELDDWDMNADFYFKHYIGFGSEYEIVDEDGKLICKPIK
jgi:hypothetical protein